MYRKLVAWTIGAALAVMTTSPVLSGQTASGTATHQSVRMSPEQVMQVLSTKLSLSDDQKANIAPIIADRQQQLRNLRDDTSMRRRKKARELKSIFEESDKKINAILTPAQQSEYARLKEQLREQMRQQRGN